MNDNEKKILIADDNVVVVKALATKLSACGYTVLTAQDGGTAVSLVRNEKPDLLLLDINFPPDVAHGGGIPWDGFLIINWLRRMDEAKSTPIILITGKDPAEFEARARAAGVIGVFQKPIPLPELLELIGRTLATPAAP
jgi:CheY-like chemotaxis protein